MTHWKLEPLKKIGDIEFGMTRDEVRKKLSLDFEEFKKNEFSKNTTDDFGDFHIYYDVSNKVEAVEVFENIEIEIKNKIIYPLNVKDITTILPNAKKFDDSTYIDYQNSIGIAISDNEISSILFAKKDYYI